MGNKRIEKVHHEYVADDHEDDRASQVSKRTRSPRRDIHRSAPWNQSPSNRHDMDIRSQHGDRRVRDIREDPNYQRLRENLSGSRGEDVRARDYYPRDDQPRGSMSSRCNYARSEPGRLEPRYYEPKFKDRKPRPDDYESDRRPDRRD